MKKMVKIEEKQVRIKYYYKYYIFLSIFHIVRNKAKYIFELLTDSFKLKDEKKKFSSWKTRIEGVGSGGVSSSSYKGKKFGKDGASFYGATSSDSYGGSISIYHDRNKDDDEDDGKKKEKDNKKESDSDSESSSSSSSDDDKKKKKKKKDKKSKKS